VFSDWTEDWTDLCAVREMALGLPNNLNPREVFEQVQLWSQNREHLDLHQLRVLIDNYDDKYSNLMYFHFSITIIYMY
jgi:hypothetical protein